MNRLGGRELTGGKIAFLLILLIKIGKGHFRNVLKIFIFKNDLSYWGRGSLTQSNILLALALSRWGRSTLDPSNQSTTSFQIGPKPVFQTSASFERNALGINMSKIFLLCLVLKCWLLISAEDEGIVSQIWLLNRTSFKWEDFRKILFSCNLLLHILQKICVFSITV